VVDNRSAGFFGIGGGFNFKGGDISGTAAKTSDDKMGQGTEYFAVQQEDDEQQDLFRSSQFVDRSAQLNATLNSLAMMNVANLIKKAHKKVRKTSDELEAEVEEAAELIHEHDEDDDFFYVD
jgi:hypothetical protein